MRSPASQAIFMCALLMSGCAADGRGSVVECHGQNWYRLGQTDGKAGAQGERQRYVTSCGPTFDAKVYDEGYRAGAPR